MRHGKTKPITIPNLKGMPQATTATAADKFERPAGELVVATTEEMGREVGLPEEMRKYFADKLSKGVYDDCLKLYNDKDNIKLAKPEIKLSDKEIAASQECLKQYGKELTEVAKEDIYQIVASRHYRRLKLLLMLDSKTQDTKIRDTQFSHLAIDSEALRFVVRVFFQMRELGGGYCGSSQFSDISAFIQAAKQLPKGRIDNTYDEMSYDTLNEDDLKKVHNIHSEMCKVCIRRLQENPELTESEMEDLNSDINLNRLGAGFLESAKGIRKRDTTAANNAIIGVRLIDPITGDDSVDIEALPLPSDFSKLTDAQKIYLCGDGGADNVIPTPFFSLNNKIRGAAQTYGGIERGEMFTICGQSGGGKSFAIAEFAITAYANRFNVLVLTLENTRKVFMDRMCKRFNPWGVYDPDVLYDPTENLGIVTFTNGNIYVAETPNNKKLAEREARRMATELTALGAMAVFHKKEEPKFFVVNSLSGGIPNANTIRAHTEMFEREYGCPVDLVLIDSAVQITPNKEMNDQHHNIIRKAVDEVHDYARDTKVSVVMSHQLNAQGNNAANNNKRPTQKEIGSTVGIFQKSAQVIILWNSRYHAETSSAELILAKSRHGEAGSVFHFMRDLPNGVGVIPYSDVCIGNVDRDLKDVGKLRRKHRA